jgi:hypothetical protein
MMHNNTFGYSNSDDDIDDLPNLEPGSVRSWRNHDGTVAHCDQCQTWSSKYSKLYSEHYRMLRHVDMATGNSAEYAKLHNEKYMAVQSARAAKEQAAFLVWQMLKLREVIQQAIKYVPAVDKCWHNNAIHLLGDIEKYKEGSWR